MCGDGSILRKEGCFPCVLHAFFWGFFCFSEKNFHSMVLYHSVYVILFRKKCNFFFGKKEKGCIFAPAFDGGGVPDVGFPKRGRKDLERDGEMR